MNERAHETTDAGQSTETKKAAGRSAVDDAPPGAGALSSASPGGVSPEMDGQTASSSQIAAGPDEKPDSTAPVGFIRQYELVDRVRAYDPDVDEDLLNRAYVFSMQAHGGQTRQSGDPYFTHPLAVAAILTELRADPAAIAAALLHDTVEDTDATIEGVRDLFGEEIARLVGGVTKLTRFELQSEATKQAENFRKLVMAMADDVRVLLIKLADRLHNMRTLHYVPKEAKRRRVALETMEIFAPLAGRIGVHRFREELKTSLSGS